MSTCLKHNLIHFHFQFDTVIIVLLYLRMYKFSLNLLSFLVNIELQLFNNNKEKSGNISLHITFHIFILLIISSLHFLIYVIIKRDNNYY